MQFDYDYFLHVIRDMRRELAQIAACSDALTTFIKTSEDRTYRGNLSMRACVHLAETISTLEQSISEYLEEVLTETGKAYLSTPESDE